MTDKISMKNYMQIEKLKTIIMDIIASGGMSIDNMTDEDVEAVMEYVDGILGDIKNLETEDKINHLVKVVIVNAAQAASLYKKLNEKKDGDE